MAATGKITGYADVAKKVKLPRQKRQQKNGAARKKGKVTSSSKALQHMKLSLLAAGISFETEYYFAKPRMFRFDIAIPDRKIAIEYEGIMSTKSRHTSVKGYTRDADKYNLAAQKGWKVLRYTALNVNNFESDLKAIIHGKTGTDQ